MSILTLAVSISTNRQRNYNINIPPDGDIGLALIIGAIIFIVIVAANFIINRKK
jgi:uncharacterized PurR-regulated membrane protein YhhQ (DUF165 family)